APAGPPAGAATSGLPARVRAVAADVWMRLYQAARLGWFWAGVVAEARRWRPDVVHANDANTLAPALLLQRLAGSAVVYDSHELWLRRNIRQDRWLAPLVEAVTEHVGVRRAAGVITVSPSIASWLRRRYRLAEEPVLVRNIPRYDGHPPPPEGGRLRELAGLGAQHKVVAYTGGITTGRGLEETLEALTLLPGDVQLVLLGYGDPAYIARFEARAAELGLAERVHLVGKVPSAQVPATLADADAAVVFVRPVCLSYRYSLPNKLFESIHAGLPVVAADLPDTAAVVREHGVGEVFDAATPAELAEAIADVLARPEAFRAAARAAAARLTWQQEARRLVGLYDRVLRRRGDRI
ncbi:glycosyltransferase, partial [Ornithinicoccus halotolerans]|uniref:glycosyltransferase n=1 Tax=Ornithinicoccus halotolerans TaxID=1748220 RepID=UPI001296CBF0